MTMDTMRNSTETQYDVASAISLGQRDHQEDAIITDFPLGSELGFAVLADGMGGHAAGDIASKIVVTEVYSELKLQSGDPQNLRRNIAEILMGAASAANDCVRAHAHSNPATQGMGATLVAPVLMRDQLYWISVGDSPLLLFRDGTLRQLNEDHSMAPQIDQLVRSGMMEPATALNHPDRHCLTSVLVGEQIPQIDCPGEPVTLLDGDIVIVASDGLQFLDNVEIAELLQDQAHQPSAEITAVLLRCIRELDDPDQDNVSFCVIKVGQPARAGLAQVRSVHGLPDRAGPATAIARNKVVTLMTSTSERGVSMMCRISSGKSA